MHWFQRVVIATGLLLLAGCSPSELPSAMDEGAVGGASSTRWIGPTPGSRDQPIDKALVLSGWKKVKRAFYETTEGYTSVDAAAPPAMSEPGICANVCPDFWSDLVCHYYCWLPTYSEAKPNMRSCFTSASSEGTRADDGPAPRRLFYPEAYDSCVYLESDWLTYKASLYSATPLPSPPYDQALIDRNKRSRTMPGPLAWLEQNAGDAFKYVMFTWYDSSTFANDAQQDVINEFYGVRLSKKDYDANDPASAADVAECNAKRPLRTSFEPAGAHCSTRRPWNKIVPHPRRDEIRAWMQSYAARQ